MTSKKAPCTLAEIGRCEPGEKEESARQIVSTMIRRNMSLTGDLQRGNAEKDDV
jgi:hypothetical protein